VHSKHKNERKKKWKAIHVYAKQKQDQGNIEPGEKGSTVFVPRYTGRRFVPCLKKFSDCRKLGGDVAVFVLEMSS